MAQFLPTRRSRPTIFGQSPYDQEPLFGGPICHPEAARAPVAKPSSAEGVVAIPIWRLERWRGNIGCGFHPIPKDSQRGHRIL